MIRVFILRVSPLLLAASLFLQGCGGKGEAKSEPVAAAAIKNPMELTVGPDLLKQIKIGEPKSANVAEMLHVAGRVEADETRLVKVSVPIAGRITELEVLEGQTVKRGQPLAGLYSAELSGSQLSLIKALSQAQLAQRAVERAKLLLTAGVIGSAELQRREAELLQASAEVSSSHDQLRVLGMSEPEIVKLKTNRTVNSLTHVVSSIDGTVLDRKVNAGQIAQPSDTIFTVADLSNVWLVADVPEQNAGKIAVGTFVEAEIPALPGHKIRGRLSFVSATVDPATRTVHVRMDLPNPKTRYKPAMLASIILKDGGQRQRVLPPGALVREQDRDYAFIQAGDDKFVMRQITLGEEFEDSRVLRDGIAQGEKVVLDGAFHLNNERKRRALQKD